MTSIHQTDPLMMLFYAIWLQFLIYAVERLEFHLGDSKFSGSATYVNDEAMDLRVAERKEVVVKYKKDVFVYSNETFVKQFTQLLRQSPVLVEWFVENDHDHNVEAFVALLALNGREFIENFISEQYARLKNIDAASILSEPDANKFATYQASHSEDKRLSDHKNYYMIGYVVYNRFKKLVASSRLTNEHRTFMTEYMEHAFYSRHPTTDQREQRDSEMGSIIDFTREIEKFDGLAYAKPATNLMFQYLSFVYYTVMSTVIAIVFHSDEPHVSVQKVLFGSSKGKELFLTSCAPSWNNESISSAKTVDEIYRFIIRGMCNVNSKDLYNRKLKSASGAKVGGQIRVALKNTCARINPDDFIGGGEKRKRGVVESGSSGNTTSTSSSRFASIGKVVCKNNIVNMFALICINEYIYVTASCVYIARDVYGQSRCM
jgi:hypothetical protein